MVGPKDGDRPAAALPGQPGTDPAVPGRAQCRVQRRAAGGLRDPARRLAGRPAGRARDGPLRAAAGIRRPGSVRPPAASRSSTVRRDEGAALGRAPLHRAGDPDRRHHLALPLRPVRLDHPLLPAVRVPAAADRLSAVPLRHPLRPGRPHRRSADPDVVDRGGGSQPGVVPPQCVVGRRHRRILHARRNRDPDLPPAHHRTGVHGDHQERQVHVRRAGGRAGGRALDHAGQRRRRAPCAQLPRDRLALVPVDLRAATQGGRDGSRSGLLPDPRADRPAALHHLAVHPPGARLHRATALPLPPLHRVSQPGRATATRRRAARRGWAPVGTRDRDTSR